MNKILLIIKREYLSRVRKKSFIIMTILGPILMAGLILAPILLMDSSDEEKKEIWVCDENNLFESQFKDVDGTDYKFFKNDLFQVKDRFITSDGYALVYIPKFENQNIDIVLLYL